MKNLMEKYINILKNTPLFQGISEAEILPMLKCLSVSIKNYSKGEYLLRSGDKIQTIGMILSGQALIINDDVWEIAILLQSYHQECSMAKAMPASAVFLLKSVLLLMKISLSCFSI